jgi:hypothetical protein
MSVDARLGQRRVDVPVGGGEQGCRRAGCGPRLLSGVIQLGIILRAKFPAVRVTSRTAS